MCLIIYLLDFVIHWRGPTDERSAERSIVAIVWDSELKFAE